MDEQHDDLAAEFTRRGTGAVAAFLGLAEALARMDYYRDKPTADQRTTATTGPGRHDDDTGPDLLQQRADENRLRGVADRVFEHARDPEWLANADLPDLGPAWAAATHLEQQAQARGDATGQAEATEVREAVESRLRETHLHLMDQYDQAVEAGHPRAEAMREAITAIFQTPGARTHGGRGHYTAIEARSDPERSFTDQIDHGRALNELADLGPAGRHAAGLLDPDAALAEMHQARAGQTLGQATTDLGIADDPRTSGLDEHSLERHEHNRDLGRINTDTQTASAFAQNLYTADWQGEQHNPAVSARESGPAHRPEPRFSARRSASNEPRAPHKR